MTDIWLGRASQRDRVLVANSELASDSRVRRSVYVSVCLAVSIILPRFIRIPALTRGILTLPLSLLGGTIRCIPTNSVVRKRAY